MSRVPDALPEVHPPDTELGSLTAPDDSQTAGLEQKLRHIEAPDAADRDLHAFATVAEMHGQVDDNEGAVPADDAGTELRDDAAQPPAPDAGRLTIPRQLTNDGDTGAGAAAVETADDTRRVSGPGAVKVGKIAAAADVETAEIDQRTEADDAADREIDLEFNEDDDFDVQTDGTVPTDLVTAWMNDMNGEILDREQVVEKSKEVEAGLHAGWIVRINDAVDDPDPDSLLNLRDEYIESRQENMRLTRQKPGKEFDGNEEFRMPDINANDQETGRPLSSAKKEALQAAVNKERKHEIAVREADEMIALALRYRQPLEPGKTELPEEMRRDLEEVDRRGVSAKDAMVGSIVRWATTESMKSSGRAARIGMAQIDVVQEGNLGAIRAVEKFDWTKGYTLSTYSTAWINQHVQRALATGKMVKTPNHIADKLALVSRREGELLAKLQPGEELTEEMVAKAAKMTVDELAELRQIDQPVLSLDKRMGDGNSEDMEYGDVVGDERTAALEADVAEKLRMAELRRAVDEALEVIGDARIEDIIRRQFGLAEGSDGTGESTNKIGEDLGISGERVRQLSRKGMARLKANEVAMGRLRLLQ